MRRLLSAIIASVLAIAVLSSCSGGNSPAATTSTGDNAAASAGTTTAPAETTAAATTAADTTTAAATAADTTTAAATAADTTTAADASTASTAADPAQPLTNPDAPSVTMTVGRVSPDGNSFVSGQDFDNNTWMNLITKFTGVKTNTIWAVAQSEYETKVNMIIASGALPDIMSVNANQLASLVQAGLIQEVGSALDKWQSQSYRDCIDQDPYAIKSATINGKVMALPYPGSPAMSYPMLFYRADWLAKYNLPVPATMDQLIGAMETFQQNNPGGANTTYGLAVCKDMSIIRHSPDWRAFSRRITLIRQFGWMSAAKLKAERFNPK